MTLNADEANEVQEYVVRFLIHNYNLRCFTEKAKYVVGGGGGGIYEQQHSLTN